MYRPNGLIEESFARLRRRIVNTTAVRIRNETRATYSGGSFCKELPLLHILYVRNQNVDVAEHIEQEYVGWAAYVFIEFHGKLRFSWILILFKRIFGNIVYHFGRDVTRKNMRNTQCVSSWKIYVQHRTHLFALLHTINFMSVVMPYLYFIKYNILSVLWNWNAHA